MSKNHDTAFMVSFLGVLAGLVALTLAIMVLAGFMSGGDEKLDETATKKTAARLAPVAQVVTDPAMLVKVSTTAAKHVPQTADQIYGAICSTCHSSGLLGAPKVGDKAAWSARKTADGGLDGLAASAEKGKNSMPPRGGNPDLTDDEIKSAIGLMLQKSGV